MDSSENVIDFITGERTATVTFTNRKHINRIKTIYEERKDDVKDFRENPDGSICAKKFLLNGSKFRQEVKKDEL